MSSSASAGAAYRVTNGTAKQSSKPVLSPVPSLNHTSVQLTTYSSTSLPTAGHQDEENLPSPSVQKAALPSARSSPSPSAASAKIDTARNATPRERTTPPLTTNEKARESPVSQKESNAKAKESSVSKKDSKTKSGKEDVADTVATSGPVPTLAAASSSSSSTTDSTALTVATDGKSDAPTTTSVGITTVSVVAESPNDTSKEIQLPGRITPRTSMITVKNNHDRLKKHPWVLHPNHVFHSYWLVVTIFVIFANAWSVPFRLSVGYNRIQGQFTAWNGTDIMFDVIYMFNIFLKTRTAFYLDGALITNPRLIWQRYLGIDLAIDVISLLPVDWFLILAQRYVEAVFLRLLRLVQFFVVARYLNELETSPGVNVTIVRLAKVFVFYLTLSHLVGCIWFAFALPDKFGQHVWLPKADLLEKPYMSQYLQALYWGLGMLSDRLDHPLPYSAGTAGFILVTQIIGILLMAYIIGNIAFAIDDANETFQRFRLQLDYVTRFMIHAKLPEEMQDRVRRFYNYMWNLNKGFDDMMMLKDLPNTLRTDVCLQLTQSTIGCNPLFQDLDVHFLHALVKVLLQRTLVPDEFVIREGEPGDEMYFIRSGIIVITVSGMKSQRVTQPNDDLKKPLALVSEGGHPAARKSPSPSPRALTTPATPNGRHHHAGSGELPTTPTNANAPERQDTIEIPVTRQVQTCVDGDLIGEFAVLLEGCPLRTSSAMAVTYCDLFVLVKDDLANLLSFYPQVQTELEQRTAKRRQMTMKKEKNIIGLSSTGGGGRENSVSKRRSVNLTSKQAQLLATPETDAEANAAAEAAKAEKMKQLLGAASSMLQGVGDGTSNPDASMSRDGGPVIRVYGKVVDPNTRLYALCVWLRIYWVTTSHVYAGWCRFIFLISVYNAIVVPFRLAFAYSEAGPALLFFDYFLDFFLLFNVVAHMFLRHPPKLSNQIYASKTPAALSSSKKYNSASSAANGTFEEFSTARWRYFKSGWMIWDLVTAAPLDFMMLTYGMNPWFRVGKWARFFTDIRVLAVSKLQSSGMNVSTVGLLQLLTGFTILTHWSSCAYWSFSYFVGYSSNPEGSAITEWLPPESFKEQSITASYLISQFQSFVLLTGFGQKTPAEGDAEIIFVIIMIMLGILLVAWAIGEVGELIANLDRFNAEFGRQMSNTNQFMTHRHFDKGIQKRVREYLSHWWSTRRGVDPHIAMENLPAGLKTDIMSHLCEELLMKVPLFATILQDDPSFGRHLIERLTFESYPAMEYVFQAGEIGDSMFFITEGEVGIIVPETHRTKQSLHARAQHDHEMHRAPSKIIGAGSFFGEVALLTNGLRTASIRALQPTFLLVLSRTALWEIMEAHPGFAEHIRELSSIRATKLAYLRAHAQELAQQGVSTKQDQLMSTWYDHHAASEYDPEISRSQGHLHIHGPYHQQHLEYLEAVQNSLDAEDFEDDDGEALSPQELIRKRNLAKETARMEAELAAAADEHNQQAAKTLLADDPDDKLADIKNAQGTLPSYADAVAVDIKDGHEVKPGVTIAPLRLPPNDMGEVNQIDSNAAGARHRRGPSAELVNALGPRNNNGGAPAKKGLHTRNRSSNGAVPLLINSSNPGLASRGVMSARLGGNFDMSANRSMNGDNIVKPDAAATNSPSSPISPVTPSKPIDMLKTLERHNSMTQRSLSRGPGSARKLPLLDVASIAGANAALGPASPLTARRGSQGARTLVMPNMLGSPGGAAGGPHHQLLRSHSTADVHTKPPQLQLQSPRPMATGGPSSASMSTSGRLPGGFSSASSDNLGEREREEFLNGSSSGGVLTPQTTTLPPPLVRQNSRGDVLNPPPNTSFLRNGSSNTSLQSRVPFTHAPDVSSPSRAANFFGRQNSNNNLNVGNVGISSLMRQGSLENINSSETTPTGSPKTIRGTSRLQRTLSNNNGGGGDHPPSEFIGHYGETMGTEATEIDWTNYNGGANGGNSSNVNFAAMALSTQHESVFARARRLHANRAVETAIRNGVVQSAEELAQVVDALETQLHEENRAREDQQRGEMAAEAAAAQLAREPSSHLKPPRSQPGSRSQSRRHSKQDVADVLARLDFDQHQQPEAELVTNITSPPPEPTPSQANLSLSRQNTVLQLPNGPALAFPFFDPDTAPSPMRQPVSAPQIQPTTATVVADSDELPTAPAPKLKTKKSSKSAASSSKSTPSPSPPPSSINRPPSIRTTNGNGTASRKLSDSTPGSPLSASDSIILETPPVQGLENLSAAEKYALLCKQELSKHGVSSSLPTNLAQRLQHPHVNLHLDSTTLKRESSTGKQHPSGKGEILSPVFESSLTPTTGHEIQSPSLLTSYASSPLLLRPNSTTSLVDRGDSTSQSSSVRSTATTRTRGRVLRLATTSPPATTTAPPTTTASLTTPLASLAPPSPGNPRPPSPGGPRPSPPSSSPALLTSKSRRSSVTKSTTATTAPSTQPQPQPPAMPLPTTSTSTTSGSSTTTTPRLQIHRGLNDRKKWKPPTPPPTTTSPPPTN